MSSFLTSEDEKAGLIENDQKKAKNEKKAKENKQKRKEKEE